MKNQTLSFYGRTDDHNTTGENQSYKINFFKFLTNLNLGLLIQQD